MFGRKRKKKRDGHVGVADVAAVEGGCCLLELVGGALSCLALVIVLPLLIG
jgi:hypothetical protein